jgi:hypothetical protein
MILSLKSKWKLTSCILKKLFVLVFFLMYRIPVKGLQYEAIYDTDYTTIKYYEYYILLSKEIEIPKRNIFRLQIKTVRNSTTLLNHEDIIT